MQPDLFQWESMTNLPQSHLDKLIKSSFTHVFIRKVSIENYKAQVKWLKDEGGNIMRRNGESVLRE